MAIRQRILNRMAHIPAYQRLQKPKIVHILRRLNDTFMSPKSERITIENPLTVEHILPQSWLDNWPLPDGSKGLAWQELSEADEDDPRRHATKQRNAALHTFGNLTILTKSLNTSVSNSSWSKKKHPLLQASLLPLNQQLHDVERWNEEVIEERSKKLFKRAVKIWPGPGVSSREDR